MTVLEHDLPPCPKVKVFKPFTFTGWSFKHWCPWHSHYVAQGGYKSYEAAMAAARAHLKHCEVT